MIGYYICNKCKGNGYLKAVIEEGREEIVIDCKECNNQGEIPMDDATISNDIKSERLQ
jgi:hypothetical protein